MRSTTRRQRLGLYALALAIALPATMSATAKADGAKKSKRKSLASCATFDQQSRDDEDGLDFAFANSCGIPVACKVTWTVVCAPEVSSRRVKRAENTSLRLEDGDATSRAAMASCGVDDWSIRDISWSCEPAKD